MIPTSEARLRAILRASRDATVVFERDGAIRFVAPAAEELFGQLTEELTARSFWDLVHPGDLTAGLAEIARGFDANRSATVEWRVLGTRNEWRWVEQTLTDLSDNPAVAGVLSQLRDVEDRERHLRLALSAAGISIWDIDVRTGHAHVFSSAPGALPVEGDDFVTTCDHFLAVIHPDDRVILQRILADEEPREDDFDFECRIRPRAVTESRWAHVKGQVLRDGSGAATRISGITMDIEDRRLAEKQQLEAAEMFRQTIDASNDAFVALDDGGRVVGWNHAAGSLLGYTSEEVRGQRIVELVASEQTRTAIDEAVGWLTRARAGAHPERHGFGPVELQLRHRHGRDVLVEASGTRVESGGSTLLHLFLRDTTGRGDMVRQLEHGLLTDPLTGLPNRALLNDRLGSALARLERAPGVVGVLFLDLDRFKVVNDALGHGAGDSLLKTVATRIRRAMRPQDSVARFGGDEFVVVVEGMDTVEDVLALADRLVSEVGRPVQVGDHQFHLGASIGIAVTTRPGTDPVAMVRDADLAMYRAKSRGGGTHELFDADMRRAVVARLELESDLRRALDHGELEVYYQPVVRLDGRLAGVEALVRWHHPVRGLINPAEFVPVAEETGLIAELGAQVLDSACTTVARWRRQLEPEMYVSVNLSVRQLTDRLLPELVAGVLERSGLAPDALCLELTETALMHDAVAAGSTLHRLRDMGVSLAVDDFGTGYSSLLYLRRFPVQVLKLDRYFVAGVAEETEDRVIIGSIIDLAHALGLKAVAEGVERESQRQALDDLGCDLAQGHLFGRAVPAASLEQILRQDAPLPMLAVPPPVELVVDPLIPAPVHSDRSPYRVLLVDDAPGDRSLLRSTLEASGQFTIVGESESADQAILDVARTQPDVVLVDLFLPGSDGLELLEDLGRVAPATRAVIVSGYVSDGVTVAANAAGALACLDKSLSSTSMVDTLTSLLAGSRKAIA